MKLTLITPALAAILGLALAGAPVTVNAQNSVSTTNAAPVTTTAPAKAPAKAKPTEYSGTLTAIDPAGASITVASTKKTLTLKLAATTSYKKDHKAASLADFAVGDKVTGSYTKDGDVLTAFSLHKSTPKAPATKPTTTTAKPATAPASTPATAPAPATK